MVRQVLLAILLLSPGVAAAQSSSAGSDAKIAANALFDEGKRLISDGSIDQACAKFEASLKLVDQLGVRLNLADCYEQQGKTATAWTEFREAASRADKVGDARAAFARQRAEALAPRLVKMRIAVAAGHRLPGLTVRRDGNAIPEAAFGSPLPVNPGSYTLEVSASGYRTWTTKGIAKKPGAVIEVQVPRLEEAPAGSEPATGEAIGAATPGRERLVVDRQRRQRLGLAIGAGGVVALGVGVGLGLAAKRKWDSAGDHCFAGDICDAEGAEINREARRYGNIGTVVGGVGVAALVTGAVLYVTAPAARQVLEHATLDASPDAASGVPTVRLGWRGQF
jgi:hypothetical protein